MSASPTRRRAAVGIAALTTAAGLVLLGASAASAHVTVSSTTAEAGAYTVLTVSVPHGCDGSATTRVAIDIPEGINAVTPTRNAFYEVEKVMEALPEPITDAHGNELTERVGQVVYTAITPLPADQRDTFELSLRLPEDAAGTTLYFPTVQTCEQGESAWIEIPAEGQDADELALPSPSVAVVAAAADAHGGHDHTAEATATPADTDAAATAATAPSWAIVITSLVLGVAGLATGVVALVRGRSRA